MKHIGKTLLLLLFCFVVSNVCSQGHADVFLPQQKKVKRIIGCYNIPDSSVFIDSLAGHDILFCQSCRCSDDVVAEHLCHMDIIKKVKRKYAYFGLKADDCYYTVNVFRLKCGGRKDVLDLKTYDVPSKAPGLYTRFFTYRKWLIHVYTFVPFSNPPDPEERRQLQHLQEQIVERLKEAAVCWLIINQQ